MPITLKPSKRNAGIYIDDQRGAVVVTDKELAAERRRAAERNLTRLENIPEFRISRSASAACRLSRNFDIANI